MVIGDASEDTMKDDLAVFKDGDAFETVTIIQDETNISIKYNPVTSPFYSYKVIDPCAASMNTMKICILSCIPTPSRSSVIATTIHMRLGSNPNYVLHGTYDNLRAVFANPNFMFYVLDNLRTSMNQASKNSDVTKRNESN